MLRKNPFIKPMAPTLATAPPVGDEWIHEVKFDGWRAQVHIEDGAATLYSKNGADITRRFRSLRPALARVPVKSAIVDCELVACDEPACRASVP
jgi:bifunctional non-homologous end joining protein LigD